MADQRAINFAQNKVAKWLVFILSAIVFVYLIGFSVLFSLIANDNRHLTSIEFIFSLSPVILSIDFFFRFLTQQTPSQLVKPYLLVPLPRYACVDMFVFNSLFNWGNLTWFLMLIPYSIMSVVFSHGILATLSILLLYYIFILANSQWYSIVRTLVNDKLSYWILPLIVYALLFSPLYIGKNAGGESFLDFYANIGSALTSSLCFIPFCASLLLLTMLTEANRRLQYIHIWRELGKTAQPTVNNTWHFNFLNRYGEIGSYLQLEVKSIIRNKNLRKTFIFATVTVIVISMLIVFTNVYDSNFMNNFWCIYNFFIMGAMLLVRIMCAEGNYIDCLLVHKENILMLLRAKYIFYSLLLLFPFLLMLPQVFAGKWSLLMLIAYAIYTAGCQYFIIFQLAVYNSTTIPLNTKITSKNGLENNYMQLIAQMVAFTIPLVLISTLETFLKPTAAYLVIMGIGILFIATHKLWLRNIYARMMKKKYILLEGFRSTR